MPQKPYLYLCENCKYKGVYLEGNKDNFEDWFCYKTKLLSSYVPCTRIKHCEISNSEKEYIDIDECRDDFYHCYKRCENGVIYSEWVISNRYSILRSLFL